MPQSLSAVYVHLVFSTKDRIPFLEDPSLLAEMHNYLGGASREVDFAPILVGGVADHVHILALHSRKITNADWVRDIKSNSSGWVKKKSRQTQNFAWQSGYGIFSVEARGLETVRSYIETQETHHRRLSFQDEYRELLKANGIVWDERYVWD